MSWGFDQRYEDIEDAIRRAFRRGKIMFAAASNQGANGPKEFGVTFPAWMPEVICINSSDGYGTSLLLGTLRIECKASSQHATSFRGTCRRRARDLIESGLSRTTILPTTFRNACS